MARLFGLVLALVGRWFCCFNILLLLVIWCWVRCLLYVLECLAVLMVWLAILIGVCFVVRCVVVMIILCFAGLFVLDVLYAFGFWICLDCLFVYLVIVCWLCFGYAVGGCCCVFKVVFVVYAAIILVVCCLLLEWRVYCLRIFWITVYLLMIAFAADVLFGAFLLLVVL